MVAFANTKGGMVLVGVDDGGSPIKNFIIGRESIQKWVNEIKTKTQPSIIPDVEVVEYKGSEIVEFFVQEFPIKPVSKFSTTQLSFTIPVDCRTLFPLPICCQTTINRHLAIKRLLNFLKIWD